MVTIVKAKQDTEAHLVFIGTAATGTNNVLTTVNSSSDLTVLGSAASGTLVNALTIALRYGLKPMYIKVATGVDGPATAVNIIGADANSGLGLAAQTEVLTGRYPMAFVVPGISNDNVVTALNTRAVEAGTLGIIDYIGTLAALNTARATSTNYGIKSQNLLIAYPQLLNGATVEYLSSHLASAIANQRRLHSFGASPNGKGVKGVTSTTPVTTTSEQLALVNNGVMTVNTTMGILFRGYRNTLAPSNTTVNSLMVRVTVEAILTRVVREWLNTRIGTQLVNAMTGYQMEMEISSLLSDYAVLGDVNSAIARYNLLNSTITDTTAVLAFDITVVLSNAVFTFTTTFTVTG